MKTILYLFCLLISIGNAELLLPDSSIDNWKVLQDGKIWIGWANDGNVDWCRTKSILDGSIDKVKKIIEAKENYPKVFKRIETSKIITKDIVYISLDMPFPFSSRDYVVKYIEESENKNLIYRFYPVKHEDVPVKKNYVRLINAMGEWRIIPINSEKTEIIYTWNGELRGDFPNWALTRAWKEQGKEVINWLIDALE